MADEGRQQRRHERRADGIYEVTIGVISERKLSNPSVAIALAEETLRGNLDAIFARRGNHDSAELLRELASAIVERLTAERLMVPD